MENEKKVTLLDENKIVVEQQEKKYPFATTQVSLPSLGKLYPKGHPLHDVDFIDLKEMTAKEEDILSSKILLKKGTAIDRLLDNCIVDKRINHKDLLVGDRNTILLALRISGYGPEYNINISCPECGLAQEAELMLDKVNIKTLELGTQEVGINEFEFKLPKSGSVVKFKLLTSGEETEVAKTQENLRKLTKSDTENLVTSRMLRQILSVDGNSDRRFVLDFINSMPIFDSRAFREYVESIEPDVIMKSEFVCKDCNEVSTVDIPITTEFFWPTGNK